MNSAKTIRFALYLCVFALSVTVGARATLAQTPEDPKTPTAASTPPAAAPAQPSEDDTVLKPAQPDFTLVALPTGLRLPKFRGAFRVTHRFLRPLDQGDFGDLASDFFGIDSGAQIGLEFRFGILPGGQVVVHRTNDRTIQFSAAYDVLRTERRSVDVTAIASVEGMNNFQESYSPAVGAVISKLFGEHAAVYLEPIWVNNTNPLPGELVDHNDTFIVGVGFRLRVRPSVYLVGEIAPRASGYDPGVNHGSFAIEKRVGGHVFQLNFSTGPATTMGQIARGGPPGNHWYLGFNISRKFY